MKILLDRNRPFYKANLHCHSANSDGALTPEELKEEYKSRGYSVLAITDHEHLLDNSYLNDDGFLTITSCELAIKEKENVSTLKDFGMRVCHLNLYAEKPNNTLTPCYNSQYDHFKNEGIENKIRHKGEYKREYSIEGINDIIKTARENGFLVCYNHPNWSLEDATQYLGYEGLFAVEIYNHGAELMGINSYSPNVFDEMLRSGKNVYCTMADDNHSKEKIDSPSSDMFGGFVMINADALDYESIINALKSGEFYASQGPEIKSLTLSGDMVRVETSPSVEISISTAGRRAEKVIAERGKTLTDAEFKVCSNDGYFRITVKDSEGKYANSQGYRI